MASKSLYGHADLLVCAVVGDSVNAAFSLDPDRCRKYYVILKTIMLYYIR